MKIVGKILNFFGIYSGGHSADSVYIFIKNELMRYHPESTLGDVRIWKYMYLCHAWSMSVRKLALIRELEPMALTGGPGYPPVTYDIKREGVEFVCEHSSKFSEEEKMLMCEVIDYYRQLKFLDFNFKLTRNGSPWHTVYKKKGWGAPISDRLISNYYNTLKWDDTLRRNLMMKLK